MPLATDTKPEFKKSKTRSTTCVTYTQSPHGIVSNLAVTFIQSNQSRQKQALLHRSDRIKFCVRRRGREPRSIFLSENAKFLAHSVPDFLRAKYVSSTCPTGTCSLPVPAIGLIALRYGYLLYLSAVIGNFGGNNNSFLRPEANFCDSRKAAGCLPAMEPM